MSKKFQSATILANQVLHSTLASTYESDEPHFRPENRAKVAHRLKMISDSLRVSKTMVDLGCGTGFLAELAPSRIQKIIGVDTTEQMLDVLRRKKLPRVELLVESVDQTFLPADVADLVTGYSVLDHFENPETVFSEAARILRPGGVFYMDLIPNADFWQGLRSINRTTADMDSIVAREIYEVAHHGQKMLSEHGVPFNVLSAAEPHKEATDGFSIQGLSDLLSKAGFKDISIHREWFLGEAEVLHSQSVDAALLVATHLQRLSPLSDHLFKYLWFTATKP